MRVLILGGYGFIGRQISARLAAAGHEIVILGRDAGAARRLLPDVPFVRADLAEAATVTAWHSRLDGIDAVVNAAGALQSGGRDNLEAVHHRAVASLVRACEARNVKQFVQISSVGASLDATTEFMRTKARGDACVRSSALDWFIVRPGLVIGPNAYGGTALIRMLASIPLIQPLALADAPVQTVSIHDLADVVLDAIEGRLPARTAFDLVEDERHALGDVLRQFRRWLGLGAARIALSIPRSGVLFVSKAADFAGVLGWRPPLRTTTLDVLADGVLGDPDTFRQISTRKLAGLAETLARMPSTVQDRWFARLYLALPIAVALLSIFWIATGIIALGGLDQSVQVTGLARGLARPLVIAGSGVDIVLGAAILYRPWTRPACLGMCIVTVLYLVAATAFRPELWLDPLGPLLKAVPLLMLAALAALLVENR